MGPTPRHRPVRKRQRLVVGGALMGVAVLAFVLVATHTASRLPGQTASGTVDLSKAAQIRRTVAQAETLQQQGDGTGALQLYRQVLAQDPTQVDALAQSGWLEFEAGVQAKNTSVLDDAESLEQAAARAQPSAPPRTSTSGPCTWPPATTATPWTSSGEFLADHPPVSQVETATPFIDQAYQGAGLTPLRRSPRAEAGRDRHTGAGHRWCQPCTAKSVQVLGTPLSS